MKKKLNNLVISMKKTRKAGTNTFLIVVILIIGGASLLLISNSKETTAIYPPPTIPGEVVVCEGSISPNPTCAGKGSTIDDAWNACLDACDAKVKCDNPIEAFCKDCTNKVVKPRGCMCTRHISPTWCYLTDKSCEKDSIAPETMCKAEGSKPCSAECSGVPKPANKNTK